MVNIMVWINYKLRCLFPNLLRTIVDGSFKYHTTLINVNVVWPQFRCWIYSLPEIQNMCWRLKSVKFGPSNYSTTWSTDSFHTVETRGNKVVIFSICCIWGFIMLLNLSIECRKPCQSFFLCTSHHLTNSKQWLMPKPNSMWYQQFWCCVHVWLGGTFGLLL